MSLKMTNGVGLKKKKRKYNTVVLVHKSYTDDGNLKINIVK